eukprot:6157226-Pleurochrysis_carterae.AAC.1
MEVKWEEGGRWRGARERGSEVARTRAGAGARARRVEAAGTERQSARAGPGAHAVSSSRAERLRAKTAQARRVETVLMFLRAWAWPCPR